MFLSSFTGLGASLSGALSTAQLAAMIGQISATVGGVVWDSQIKLSSADANKLAATLNQQYAFFYSPVSGVSETSDAGSAAASAVQSMGYGAVDGSQFVPAGLHVYPRSAFSGASSSKATGDISSVWSPIIPSSAVLSTQSSVFNTLKPQTVVEHGMGLKFPPQVTTTSNQQEGVVYFPGQVIDGRSPLSKYGGVLLLAGVAAVGLFFFARRKA